MSEHITEEVTKAYDSGIRRYDVHLDNRGWTYQIVICSLIDLSRQLAYQNAVDVKPVYPAERK
jgi:hypothetical protein